MPFSFLGRAERLAPRNITIREQARLAENPNDLRWPDMAPRQEVDSTKFSEITKREYRPVAERRGWDAQSREIPDVTGVERKGKIAPIGLTKTWGEEELQEIGDLVDGNDELAGKRLMRDVESRGPELADAVDRRIELDFFTSWHSNVITVRDGLTNESVSVNMQVDATRYVTELTPWTDNSVNAWVRFADLCHQAQKKLGSLKGVRMRRVVADRILKDAPAQVIGNQATGLKATIEDLEKFLRANKLDVTIIIDERTVNTFVNAGGVFTDTYLVPTSKILFQPASGVVASTKFAAVRRATQYVKNVTTSQMKNVVLFWHTFNEGKALKLEATAIAVPLMNELATFVADVGL